jgi:hypothetical protein
MDSTTVINAERIMMHLRFIWLTVVLVVAGCAKSTPSDLAALVIRTEFRDVPPGAVACISVDGHDADSNLLHNLDGIGAPVIPGSRCTYVATPSQASHERDSNRPAVLVDVTSHLDRDEVVYVSRHHAKWAMRVVLKVRKENGTWKIVDTVEREAA